MPVQSESSLLPDYNLVMPRRPRHHRGIRSGQISNWPNNVGTPKDVADQVTYTGSAVHKNYPSPAGPPGLRADKAKCDRYAVENWPLLVDALQQAIRARCVSNFRGAFPERVWVWINDVLHEARLTNQATGDYHGFPVTDSRQYPEPLERLELAPHVNIRII